MVEPTLADHALELGGVALLVVVQGCLEDGIGRYDQVLYETLLALGYETFVLEVARAPTMSEEWVDEHERSECGKGWLVIVLCSIQEKRIVTAAAAADTSLRPFAPGPT